MIDRKTIYIFLFIVLLWVVYVLINNICTCHNTCGGQQFSKMSNDRHINLITPTTDKKVGTVVENRTSTTVQKSNKPIRITIYRNSPGYDPYSNFNFSQCEYSNCLISKDITYIKESEAVLFFYRYLGDVPTKSKGQLWLIYTFESPESDQPLSPEWNNMFDLCLTYRTDSEIDSWFKIRRRDKPLQKDYSKIFRSKTKFASWAVSHCYTASQREEYVKELQKYVNIDIFGRCGTNKTACSNISQNECLEMLSKEYKFYLGFENSLCKDYVTEKVMCNYYDHHDSIVVYRGAPNAHDVLPKGTFINAKDYGGSPKTLADFLLRLASNESEYISYLEEKGKFSVDMDNESRFKCNLCKLLNTYKSRNMKWPARDFNNWYRNNTCQNLNDLKELITF